MPNFEQLCKVFNLSSRQSTSQREVVDGQLKKKTQKSLPPQLAAVMTAVDLGLDLAKDVAFVEA